MRESMSSPQAGDWIKVNELIRAMRVALLTTVNRHKDFHPRGMLDCSRPPVVSGGNCEGRGDENAGGCDR